MTPARILRAWDKLPAATQQAGMAWYPTAHRQARDIARESGHSLATVCGVIARLSPSIRWKHNVEVARTVCMTGQTTNYSGYKRNARKAVAILTDGWTDAPAGPKINAFYRNLLDPADHEPVTIDRHILTWAKLPNYKKRGPNPSQYKRLAEPWGKAARKAGIPANALQAGIWLNVVRGGLTKWQDFT